MSAAAATSQSVLDELAELRRELDELKDRVTALVEARR